MCLSILPLLAATVIVGCSSDWRNRDENTATLYRNSPLSNSMRVHWATFDTADGLDHNLGNCGMAARILNANIEASARAEGKEPFQDVGFWCETGGYSEAGEVPTRFDAEYPSDTRSEWRWTN